MNVTRETISDLITRIEAGSGRDEALEADIVAAFNDAIAKPYPPTDDFGPRNKWQFWSRDGAHFLGSESKYPVPNYTTSLDAVIALVERVLPESDIEIAKMQTLRTARVSGGGDWYRGNQRIDGSLARALLIAMLRAIEAREGLT